MRVVCCGNDRMGCMTGIACTREFLEVVYQHFIAASNACHAQSMMNSLD